MEALSQKTKNLFEKSLEWFKKETSLLKSSRVGITLIEGLRVDYYGSNVSLKEIASLSMLDPRTISIEPWDKSSIPNIEKSILKSALGGSVKNENNRILVSFSSLTGEDREKTVKLLKKKAEETREGLRHSRDEIWKEIQEKERAGEISEDSKFKQKDELQKQFDEYKGKIEDTEKKKEEEIRS